MQFGASNQAARVCAFILLFIIFVTRRLLLNKEKCRGTLYSEVSALSESSLKEKLFLSCYVSSADRRMQLDLCETILKKMFLMLHFSKCCGFYLGKNAWDLLLHKNRGS